MLYNTDGFGSYAIISSGIAYGQEFDIWRYAKSFLAALIVSWITRDCDNALKVTIGSNKDGNVKVINTWIRKRW